MRFILRLVTLSLLVAVWFVLPVWTYIGWGREATEKMLTLFVVPVGLGWNLLILGSVIAAYRGYKGLTVLMLAAMLLISLAGNSTLGTRLTGHLEDRFAVRSPDDFREPLRAIVMLGGCARRLPSGRVEVNGEGQRIITTAEFWNAGKTHWIITTGRQPEPDPHDASLIATELLEKLGVPRNRILRIPARNTAEEIKSIRHLIDNPPPGFATTPGEVGLVTSAFHMPRAMRLAEAAQFELVPLPSGHHASHKSWSPVALVPNSEAVDGNSLIAKELLAKLVGR